MERRFYWLRLKEDFFESKRIKKLRRLPGGDTLTLIYLKMQLKSINNNGELSWTGLENSFADELALELDEEADNIKLLLPYLCANGLAELTEDGRQLYLPYAIENTGSEAASAERVRIHRAKQKEALALQCNADVTKCNVEKEKDIDIDINKERESREKETRKEPPKRFTPPTKEEVQAYCTEKGCCIDADKFIDYYTSNGWKVGRNPMKDWKATVRNWAREDTRKHPAQKQKSFDSDEFFRVALAKAYGDKK